MLVVVDYGMGNLRSVAKALECAGGTPIVSAKSGDIAQATQLVLPGVGAGPQAMHELRERGLLEPIREHVARKKPYLGICLGLQLLFDTTEELSGSAGLRLLRGTVRRFQFADPARKVPHIGWNRVRQQSSARACPLFEGVPDSSYFYFVHSFYVDPVDTDVVSGLTAYGGEFTSAVWRENIFATQFHPEKSQALGLKVLENFLQLCHSTLM